MAVSDNTFNSIFPHPFSYHCPTCFEFQYYRLLTYGGTNLKMAVIFNVDACLTNHMQMKFNWEGRMGWKTKANENKTGFKATHLCALITRKLHAVLWSKQYPLIDDFYSIY